MFGWTNPSSLFWTMRPDANHKHLLPRNIVHYLQICSINLVVTINIHLMFSHKCAYTVSVYCFETVCSISSSKNSYYVIIDFIHSWNIQGNVCQNDCGSLFNQLARSFAFFSYIAQYNVCFVLVHLFNATNANQFIPADKLFYIAYLHSSCLINVLVKIYELN